jgi:transposase
LLPECLDDHTGQDNPVRIVEAFVEERDLLSQGLGGADSAATSRQEYRPAVLLKLYTYGYLNRIQFSRPLAREAQRNVELMWLTGRLAPDFKTIADFPHDNGAGIRNVYKRFIGLCRDLKLFSQAIAAIEGSKFKAVNSRATLMLLEVGAVRRRSILLAPSRAWHAAGSCRLGSCMESLPGSRMSPSHDRLTPPTRCKRPRINEHAPRSRRRVSGRPCFSSAAQVLTFCKDGLLCAWSCLHQRNHHRMPNVETES